MCGYILLVVVIGIGVVKLRGCIEDIRLASPCDPYQNGETVNTCFATNVLGEVTTTPTMIVRALKPFQKALSLAMIENTQASIDTAINELKKLDSKVNKRKRKWRQKLRRIGGRTLKDLSETFGEFITGMSHIQCEATLVSNLKRGTLKYHSYPLTILETMHYDCKCLHGFLARLGSKNSWKFEKLTRPQQQMVSAYANEVSARIDFCLPKIFPKPWIDKERQTIPIWYHYRGFLSPKDIPEDFAPLRDYLDGTSRITPDFHQLISLAQKSKYYSRVAGIISRLKNARAQNSREILTGPANLVAEMICRAISRSRPESLGPDSEIARILADISDIGYKSQLIEQLRKCAHPKMHKELKSALAQLVAT